MHVMADQDHRAGIGGQGFDQRLAAFDVQMVGRLIQDQQMRRIKRGQTQRQPCLLPARQARHLGFRLFASKGALPPSGIYAFELELYSNDGATLPSAPFWLVFNDGRSAEELEEAVAWIDANLVDGGATCPADLDGDGAVGASDLATLLAAWGTGGADLSGDGLTDAGDLAALLASWGACP